MLSGVSRTVNIHFHVLLNSISWATTWMGLSLSPLLPLPYSTDLCYMTILHWCCWLGLNPCRTSFLKCIARLIYYMSLMLTFCLRRVGTLLQSGTQYTSEVQTSGLTIGHCTRIFSRNSLELQLQKASLSTRRYESCSVLKLTQRRLSAPLRLSVCRMKWALSFSVVIGLRGIGKVID